MQVGKNDWDANHIACVYNYLRFAGGVSSPRFVTSDNDFIRLVQQEGYTVLNPEKMTIEEVETRLTEIPSLSRS